MKANNQHYVRVEIIKRQMPQPVQKRKRIVTQAKRKDLMLFSKQKEKVFTPTMSLQNYKEVMAGTAKNNGCLNTIFNKQAQYQQFADKCFTYLSRKKLSHEENSGKSSAFCTMLQNIKKSIKQNDQKEKQQKQQSPSLHQNDLTCIRSQIHQMYNNADEKIQLYKMIKSNQNKLLKREGSYKNGKNGDPNSQSASKFFTNPFLANRTIVCFTMALNEPQVLKKPLFEAPSYRVTTTSISKRVQISKPVQPRSMCFQVSGDGDSQYMRKLKNFLDFLFKINYSNNVYVPFELAKIQQNVTFPRYKAYIGKGNNSLLVKSLIKRRFWWQIVDSPQLSDIHFYWSQNIVEVVHSNQKSSSRQQLQLQKPKKKQIDEIYDSNRKILSIEKCSLVQKFILKDGFIIPFQELYSPDLISNHLPRNYCIGSKKNLFKSLFHFFTHVKHKNPFDFIPKTYHIKSTDDIQYKLFIKQNQQQPEKVWIIKPGQNTNRGNGINLSTFKSIQNKLKKTKHQNGQPFTYIIQSYINRPFLYNNRKFDIRHYLLLTSVNGLLKAYWYREGYIRTSSEYFDLQDLDNLFIHLTNDAIQRKSQDYQKFQPANKLSYSEFQRYLDYTYPTKGYNFQKDILTKMKELACYIVRANYNIIDHKRHMNNFEIFGLDYMIDRDFKPWLIEVNYNPCLQVNCAVLERIIPSMVQNSLRIGLDPLFPPTMHFPASKRFCLTDHYLKNLRYQLIFDEQSLKGPLDSSYEFIDEKQEQQEYQDQGQEVNQLIV